MEQHSIQVVPESQILECRYCSKDGYYFKDQVLCQECKRDLHTYKNRINVTLAGTGAGIIISGLVLRTLNLSIFSLGTMFGTFLQSIYRIMQE